MIRSFLKVFTLCSISFVLVLIPTRISNGCGGGYYVEEYYNFIMSPEVIQEPMYEPFFLSYDDRFYNNATALENMDIKQNVDSWAVYFESGVKEEDIQFLIYNTSLEDIKHFIKEVNAKTDKRQGTWLTNTALSKIYKTSDLAFLKYLAFAKACIPHVTSEYDWEAPERDVKAMTVLMNEAINKSKEVSNKILKDRYAYQAIRLAHYSYMNDKCVELYNQFFANDNSENVIRYWAMSHKAGALQDDGEALYTHSIVFDKCPSRRVVAVLSHRYSEEESLAKALSLCKTNHEKATLLFLSGLEKLGYALKDMEQIIKYDPASPMLEVLMSREIKNLEFAQPVLGYLGSDYIQDIPEEANPDATNLIKFAVTVGANKKVKRPYFWYLAAGYLSYLNKDIPSARKYLEKSKKSGVADPKFMDQVRIVSALVKIEETEKPTTKFEEDILNDLKWMKSEVSNLYKDNSFRMMRYKLGKLYSKNSEVVKSLLAYPENLHNYKDKDGVKEKVKSLIDFFERGEKSKMEQFLADLGGYNKAQMYELYGTIFLSYGEYQEAINHFKSAQQTNPSALEDFPADPFHIRIKDCFECDFEMVKKTTYNKLSLAETLLKYEGMAENEKDPERKARHKLILANAHYNMTYFGSSYMALDYSRPYYFYRDNSNVNFYDCSKARDLYEEARKLTKNRELAAKCCFLAAKCDQNAFYIEDLGPDEYRRNFDILMDEYSTTAFYRQAIEECEYFKEYVRE